MTIEKKHILILPRWYPNKKDIQLGIFIKNQALLLKSEFNISVIYVQSDTSLNEPFKIIVDTSQGINEQVVYFKGDTSVFKKIINFYRYKKAQKLAYSNLVRKVDLCHVHVPIRPTFLAVDILKKNNIPFVITEHWSGHLTGEYNNKPKHYKSYYKKTLTKAHKICCVSHFLKDSFKKNTGFTSEVIPNYIETNLNEKLIDKNQINILSVNDFVDDIKNISGIISAFKTASSINPKLHLTLIGGGPDFKKIVKSIDQSKLSNITLLGRLTNKEVLSKMVNCDFYISNSNFETFGMTIAEALMAGKPVISTLSGGPNEFLTSNLILKKKSMSNFTKKYFSIKKI